MKSCHPGGIATLFLLIFLTPVSAQEQRAFNQNASRSNHGLSVSFSPLYSIATKTSSDSLLFRGNGAGFRFGADYFFGNAGISFSSGFGSSAADDATINNFLKKFPIPASELTVTKARQQNMYLLLGPTVRVGNTVELSAHAKGGLFINNSGLVSIQQKGAQRAAYRNESSSKSVYPGFLTGAAVQYKTKSDAWSFGITMDYMNTRTEVNNYDIRRGGGIEALKLSRNITDLVTGVVVRYNILSPRDHASGQSTGKRQLGKPKYEDIQAAPRDAASGRPTGRRSYQPGQPVYGNLTTEESCGTVTQRTTNPDGSTEEMTFACPADAANYNSRISMNVTVPKQTQGATFGEKVNAGLHAAGGALAQGAAKQGIVHRDIAARNILSGRLSWNNAGSTGIVTNESAAVSSVGNLAGGAGGGAAAASYAATGRMIPNNSGTGLTMYARDAASGRASGKRSRDAGSGMATGRRQYEPIFAEGQGNICNPCVATAKLSSVQNNPLYKDKGMSGSNPLYQGKDRTMAPADEDCDGIAEADILLIDAESGQMVAQTKTERCGNFFFANLPEGKYVVKVSTSYLSKKGYDVYLKSKTDLLGGITPVDDWNVQLTLNTDGDDGMTQKAGISTSRSNLRTKALTIIEADLDGDGEYESKKILAELTDGTTKDVTATSRMTSSAVIKKVTVRGWNPEKKEAIIGTANNVKEYTISIDDKGVTVSSEYENGKKEETRVAAKVSHHPNVVQYTIPLDDAGTPANSVAAPFVPGGGIVSAAMRPVGPIKGVIVKGGRNPGSGDRTTQSDENGEFEFNNLDAGDYTFTVEQQVWIDDEVVVEVGTRAQDHNSSRSNKTASLIDNNTGNDDGTASRKGWDGTVKGGSITRGDIGTVAIEENQPVTFRWTPLVPKPKEPVTYRLRVWQLMQGQNGTQARQANQPIIEKVITNANEATVAGILTGPCKPPYLCDFIWSVQRINNAGVAQGNSDGGTFSAAQPQTKIQNNADAGNERKGWDGTVKGGSISKGDIGTIDIQENQPVTFRWTPLVPKPKEPVTYRLRVWQLMQGQNGTQARQANQPIVEKIITNANEATVAGILTGPCKPPYLCDFIWSAQLINSAGVEQGNSEGGTFSAAQPQTKAQNNNTVRSNRTELKSVMITADLDGDGEYETDVTNQVSDEITIDESGQVNAPQMKTGVSTSRSNIRTRGSLQSKGDDVYVSYGNADLNNKTTAIKILYSAKAGKTGSAR
jgi:hypothetical protein